MTEERIWQAIDMAIGRQPPALLTLKEFADDLFGWGSEDEQCNNEASIHVQIIQHNVSPKNFKICKDCAALIQYEFFEVENLGFLEREGIELRINGRRPGIAWMK